MEVFLFVIVIIEICALSTQRRHGPGQTVQTKQQALGKRRHTAGGLRAVRALYIWSGGDKAARAGNGEVAARRRQGAFFFIVLTESVLTVSAFLTYILSLF